VIAAALRRAATALAPTDPDRIHWVRSAPFVALQLAAFAVPLLAGFGPREAGVTAATYAAGMFFVTAGYHRYFSHRAFRTSRAFQLVLAVGAQCTAQKGVLWWAGHHRDHHRFSDRAEDVHSPSKGFLWSHLGWFLSMRHEEPRWGRVKDLARFPELRWLERWHFVPPLALGATLAAVGGWRTAGGWLAGIFLLHHATFTINSLAHLWGTRPHPTQDGSRNNALLALLTFGEGWHNNHHWSPSSARQGFRWWQLDVTFHALRALAALGVVWDLRPAPAADPAPRARPARAPRRGSAVRPAGAVLAAVALLGPAPGAAVPPPADGGARVERFTGTARGEDGMVLYVEEHAVELEHGRARRATTRYRAPGGALLAELESDYASGPHAPSYVFRDHRTGAAEAVTVDAREVRLEAGGRTRSLPRTDRLATGQGLDRLVRDRLGALAAGEELRVRYAIPSRHDAYAFRIRAVGDADGPRLRARVEPASFVLRLFAPDLEVEYDRASGRLLRYRGASNLSFGARDGPHPEVEITYTYPATVVAADEAPHAP
jgi:stearoyl-CoA desaturase (delta-9 desaturase)